MQEIGANRISLALSVQKLFNFDWNTSISLLPFLHNLLIYMFFWFIIIKETDTYKSTQNYKLLRRRKTISGAMHNDKVLILNRTIHKRKKWLEIQNKYTPAHWEDNVPCDVYMNLFFWYHFTLFFITCKRVELDRCGVRCLLANSESFI